jgi:hypothetical protein
MRDRQHLGALRIRDGVITLEQLYYADEIRDVDEIKASRPASPAEELKLAERLIESFTTDWKPQKYKDTYRDELCAIIRAKRKGQGGPRRADVEEEAPSRSAHRAPREHRAQPRRLGRAARRPRRPVQAGARAASEAAGHRGPLEDDEGGARQSAAPRGLEEATSVLDRGQHRAAEGREPEDHDRRDHGEDDGVLRHRLSFFPTPAGGSTVDPARGRHARCIGPRRPGRHASSW